MWFAFNFYLWLIDIHFTERRQTEFCCCDLLSISIFDLLIYTNQLFFQIVFLVVICFQFLSLTYWYTLEPLPDSHQRLLWFAFNFYLWLIDIHLCQYFMSVFMCCDLLSISIFDLLIYTVRFGSNILCVVVICFQFLSLTYWYTLLTILH